MAGVMLRLAIAALLLGCAAAAQAMPMLVAVIASYAVTAAVTAGFIAAATAVALNVAIFVGTLAYGAIEQRRAKGKARNAYNASLSDRYAPVMSAAQAPWQIIYGECVVAPCQVAAQLTSGSRDEFKHVVYVWAAHQCEAITDTLIAGVSVGALDANGWVTGGKFYRSRTQESEALGATLDGSGSATLAYAPGQVQNIAYATGIGENDIWEYLTPGQFTLVGAVLTVGGAYVAIWAGRFVTVNTLRTVNNSLLRVRHHLGTGSQAADAALLAEVPADWSSTDQLLGLCYSVVTYGLDEPEFQGGPPDLKVRVKGMRLYDDRSSTTVWSANAALAIRNFLRTEYGKNCSANQLDTASIIAAANVCDEALASHAGAARYTVNGAFRTDMDPDATLDALCQAMGGFVAWNGGQWSVQAGAYAAPVQALTDSDNWGPVEVIADRPGDEIFNGLKGRFFDPARYDQLTDYTPYQNAAFVTADGAALWDDLDLPFTNAHWRAHNLARILVERSRGMQLVFPAKLTAVKLKVGQRVTLDNSVLGIATAVFRIVKREYGIGGPVRLTLQQDDPTMWDEADAPAVLDSPASDAPDPFVVAPVAGLTATSGDAYRQTAADGGVISRVLVQVTPSTDALVTAHGALQVEYRLESDTAWLRAPEAPGAASQMYLQGLKDQRRYTIRARWRNGIGAVGDWRVVDVLVQGKLAAAPDVTGLAGTVGNGLITWTWNEADFSDYLSTEARLGGTSWATASVPAVFSGLASTFSHRVSSVGTYTLRAKHYNRSGGESASAAVASVEVTSGDLSTGGLNTALVYIFKRSASAPALPSATVTYTFGTGAIAGLNNGWTAAVPSGTDPLYVSVATASDAGATDTIASGEWATPVIMAQDGLNAATVYLFKRTATSSPPALPSATVTYTFATGVATGVDNGWTQSMPTSGGSFRWMTTASALGTGPTETIGSGEWAAAALMAEDGADGADGAPGAPGDYTPDYTPPPTPTGLAVTAGLTQLIIEWTAPVYTQGHGNAETNIYGAIWASGAAEPVFADAELIAAAVGTSSILSYATPLNTRWCIWIKFKTADGVESTSPAGGTHGVQATTGKIGNADLNDLIISAEKLSQGTYPNVNLVPNPGSEDGTSAWAVNRASGGSTATFTASTADKVGGSTSFKIAKSSASIGRGICCRAFPVIPGETYAVRARVRANAASAAGRYIVMEEAAAKPSTGYIGLNATGTDAVTDRNSATYLANNEAFLFGWGDYVFTYTVPAGVYWVSLAVYSWDTGTNVDMYLDDCSVGRQITAESLAANSIAVGSAAIQNGAIVNAMIGTAAIDNAKIADVSAAKLTAGYMQVGSYIRSTSYTGGSVGWSILANGNAEFNDVTVRGGVYATFGSIGNLTVGGALTLNSSGHIKGGSSAYDTGDGFFLGYSTADYKFSIRNASSGHGMTWDGEFLRVRGASMLGAVTVTSTGHIKGGQSDYNTGTGFFLGYSGADYKLSIGNPSGKYMKWDGSTLTVNGNAITGTSLVVTGGVTLPTFSSGTITDLGGTATAGTPKYLGAKTASPSGGDTPYSYKWSIISQYSNPSTRVIYLTGTSTATVGVYISQMASGNEANADIQCIVTDDNGRTAVATFNVGVLGV